MKLTEAIQLIKNGISRNSTNENWADLGCGAGLFTRALASMLGGESNIFAVDKDAQRIRKDEGELAAIEFIKLDFIQDPFPFSNLDGILMANSLHYVKDKGTFIEKLKANMKPDGRVIIIEYDTEKANAWIPYPIDLKQLSSTFASHGFGKVRKIGERESVYRADKMYSCVVERE